MYAHLSDKLLKNLRETAVYTYTGDVDWRRLQYSHITCIGNSEQNTQKMSVRKEHAIKKLLCS